jgi:hypothetical protein
MQTTIRRLFWFLVFVLVSGCSATRYEVRVSYSPVPDCDISAKVFGN